VVVVEGFEGTAQAYGYLHYESVSTGYTFDSNGDRIYTHMSKLAWLMDSLLLRNHDIVYVDFEESKLALEENAETLLQVLQWIQEQSPGHPTTVVGASLGGLITRYALLQAHEQGCCVGVGAYATFDSPHRGAFIPVGIQAQTERIAALFPAVKVLSNPWDYTLASKAAHQMLVSHYDPVAKASFEAFQRTILNRHPSGMYSFGVCNGSIEGLNSEPEDSLDRYISYGWERNIPVGHHVGALPDTLQFNRQGVLKNMQVVGARSEAHTGQRPFLMESAKLKNIWRVAQMRWTSMSGAASAQLIYSAGHATNFIPANVVNAAVERIQLATHQRLQSLYNASLQQGLKVPKARYPQAFDHIPGSLTDTPESFGYPFVQVFNQTHCFIPSHSALDLRNDTLRIDQRLHEIPFTSFYAPISNDKDSAKNQLHIETTEEIIEYILNQFHSIYDSYHQPITGTFNNALPLGAVQRYKSNLSGVQIAIGGHLKLACQGPVGKSNSSVVAATQQQLSFYVGPGCQGSVLEVLGSLDIGDHADRTADLYIKKGSTLVLFDKSKTVIGPGSRLIVEEGAKLVIHPKAELYLNGGSLIQHGILEILPGAIFSPLASGTIELQATTVFEGNGAIAIASHDIKVDGAIRIPKQIAYVHWTDVHCSLNNLGTIELETSGEFKHCLFEQVNAKPYLSLVAMGTELYIGECRFIKGLAAVTIADSTKWSIKHSYFNGCDMGLRALSTPTSFESNTFESCVIGVEIEATGGAAAISGSNFKHCKDIGLVVSNAHLRITCSSFQFNNIGLLVQEGTLDLARHAGTKWINNDTAVYVWRLNGLDMAQGHNRFQGNVGYDLYGTIDTSFAIARSNGVLQLAAPYNAFSVNGSIELRQHRNPIYLKYNPTQSISPHLCPRDIENPEDPSSFSNAYEGSLRIAPNPSSSGAGILFLPSPFKGGTVRLISSQGALVLEREVKAGMRSIMIERPLVKGAYTVQFIHGEQTHALKWMVVN
jgi:pimeloyl-ACP methyl ester carboxylesterase